MVKSPRSRRASPRAAARPPSANTAYYLGAAAAVGALALGVAAYRRRQATSAALRARLVAFWGSAKDLAADDKRELVYFKDVRGVHTVVDLATAEGLAQAANGAATEIASALLRNYDEDLKMLKVDFDNYGYPRDEITKAFNAARRAAAAWKMWRTKPKKLDKKFAGEYYAGDWKDEFHNLSRDSGWAGDAGTIRLLDAYGAFLKIFVPAYTQALKKIYTDQGADSSVKEMEQIFAEIANAAPLGFHRALIALSAEQLQFSAHPRK